MFKRMTLVILVLVIMVLTPQASASWSHTKLQITPETWTPATGDHMIVDVDKNMGYLVHADGSKLMFPVSTGQRRYVSYIGKRYYAATPKQEWVIKSDNIQSDRITFGKEGLFLRLYSSNQRTSYGIHTVSNADELIAGKDRYKSMGCTLVTQKILDIVENTYRINGELKVSTV